MRLGLEGEAPDDEPWLLLIRVIAGYLLPSSRRYPFVLLGGEKQLRYSALLKDTCVSNEQARIQTQIPYALHRSATI